MVGQVDTKPQSDRITNKSIWLVKAFTKSWPYHNLDQNQHGSNISCTISHTLPYFLSWLSLFDLTDALLWTV